MSTDLLLSSHSLEAPWFHSLSRSREERGGEKGSPEQHMTTKPSKRKEQERREKNQRRQAARQSLSFVRSGAKPKTKREQEPTASLLLLLPASLTWPIESSSPPPTPPPDTPQFLASSPRREIWYLSPEKSSFGRGLLFFLGDWGAAGRALFVAPCGQPWSSHG
jgi:hypothetical protein